jgi:hypothetical protein
MSIVAVVVTAMIANNPTAHEWWHIHRVKCYSAIKRMDYSKKTEGKKLKIIM